MADTVCWYCGHKYASMATEDCCEGCRQIAEAHDNAVYETCALCEREATNCTEHHLIPRSTHRRKRIKAMHSFEAMHTTATLCQPCHRAMHQFFPEMQLATEFFTIEKLLIDERIRRHVAFVQKQRGNYRMKRSAKGRAR